MSRTRFGRALALGVVAAGLFGCGDDGGSGPSGQVEAPWDAYCVATFTEDFDVLDFDEVAFTAAKGDAYLLSSLDFGGRLSPEIYFMGKKGVTDFELEIDPAAPPFTSNCAVGMTERRVGVFHDVTVYKDEEASDVACELTAGTTWVSGGGGYGLASDLTFDDSKPMIYQIEFEGLAEHCNGATEGYIKVYSEVIGSTHTDMMPLGLFIAPAPASAP